MIEVWNMSTKSSSKTDYFFTKRQIRNGIKRCINKTKLLLRDANLLINPKWLHANAIGLYTFAVEEYGKALLLKDCLSAKNTGGRFVVSKMIFGMGGSQSHTAKIQRAFKELPNECQNFQIGIYLKKPHTFKGKIKYKDMTISGSHLRGLHSLSSFADFDIRKECFYVGWDEKNNQWNYELMTTSDYLREAISSFKLHLRTFRY